MKTLIQVTTWFSAIFTSTAILAKLWYDWKFGETWEISEHLEGNLNLLQGFLYFTFLILSFGFVLIIAASPIFFYYFKERFSWASIICFYCAVPIVFEKLFKWNPEYLTAMSLFSTIAWFLFGYLLILKNQKHKRLIIGFVLTIYVFYLNSAVSDWIIG